MDIREDLMEEVAFCSGMHKKGLSRRECVRTETRQWRDWGRAGAEKDWMGIRFPVPQDGENRGEGQVGEDRLDPCHNHWPGKD